MSLLVNVIVSRVFPILGLWAAIGCLRHGHDLAAAALVVVSYSLAENSDTP